MYCCLSFTLRILLSPMEEIRVCLCQAQEAHISTLEFYCCEGKQLVGVKATLQPIRFVFFVAGSHLLFTLSVFLTCCCLHKVNTPACIQPIDLGEERAIRPCHHHHLKTPFAPFNELLNIKQIEPKSRSQGRFSARGMFFTESYIKAI